MGRSGSGIFGSLLMLTVFAILVAKILLALLIVLAVVCMIWLCIYCIKKIKESRKVTNNLETFSKEQVLNAKKLIDVLPDGLEKDILWCFVVNTEVVKQKDEKERECAKLQNKTSQKNRQKYQQLINDISNLEQKIQQYRIVIDFPQFFIDFIDAFKVMSTCKEVFNYKDIDLSLGKFGYIETSMMIPVLPGNNGILYYIYPEYIIAARSEIDFRVIPLQDFALNFSTISVKRKNIYPSDSIVSDRSFRYTCLDGTPDLRYKHNDCTYTLSFGKINYKDFTLYLSCSTKAENFVKSFNKLKEPQSTQNSHSIKPPPKTDIIEMENIIANGDVIAEVIGLKGIDVLNSRQFIYLMDDYGVFQDTPKQKFILKNMIADGVLYKIAQQYKNELIIKKEIARFVDKTGFDASECTELVNKIISSIR